MSSQIPSNSEALSESDNYIMPDRYKDDVAIMMSASANGKASANGNDSSPWGDNKW